MLAADLYAWKVAARARSMIEPPPGEVDPNDLAKVEQRVRQELAKQAVKAALCAALKSATNNIRGVSQVVVATLLPLALAGTISVPLTPLALAAAAVIVFDAGVAAFCSDEWSNN